jgi:hypothetical protein
MDKHSLLKRISRYLLSLSRAHSVILSALGPTLSGHMVPLKRVCFKVGTHVHGREARTGAICFLLTKQFARRDLGWEIKFLRRKNAVPMSPNENKSRVRGPPFISCCFSGQKVQRGGATAARTSDRPNSCCISFYCVCIGLGKRHGAQNLTIFGISGETHRWFGFTINLDCPPCVKTRFKESIQLFFPFKSDRDFSCIKRSFRAYQIRLTKQQMAMKAQHFAVRPLQSSSPRL